MEANISKPMSVARAEFISSLNELVANSKLPPFVVEAAIKDMYDEIKIITQNQLKSDYDRYQRQLEECPHEEDE